MNCKIEGLSHTVGKFFLIIILTVMFTSQVWTLNPNVPGYKTLFYGIEDGLPQSYVSSILQDSKDFIWICTQEGLTRFDGYTFKTYGKEHGLTDDHFNFVLEYSHNTILLGTYNDGLNVIKFSGINVFEVENINVEDGLNHNQINYIAVDEDENVYLASNKGLNIIPRDVIIDNSLKNSSSIISLTEKDGLLSNNVNFIFEDKDGSIWLGTDSGINFITDGKLLNKTIKKEDGLSSNNVTSICVDEIGRYWIGSEDGLNCITFAGTELKIKTFGKEEGLLTTAIRTVLVDRNQNIWIGTIKGGLFRYNQSNFVSFNEEKGLSSNMVRCLMEDKEDSLWVGTFGSGVNVLQESKFYSYTEDNGLSSSNIFTLYEDSKQQYWIGTGNGLNKLVNRKFSLIDKEDGLSDNTTLSVIEDQNGGLWVGTMNGLNLIKDNVIYNFHENNGLCDNFILALYIDSKNYLWIGTVRGGISIIDLNKVYTGNKKKFDKQKLDIKVITSEDGIASNNVHYFLEDKKGRMWIATNDGLSCMKDDKFITIKQKDGLSHNFVIALYIDSKDNLWISTFGGGLCRVISNNFYNVKLDELKDSISFECFDKKDGLPSDNCYWITEDEKGYLWLSTNKGICRFNKKDKFDVYTIKDGLPSNECNGGTQPSGVKSSGGLLIFQTIKGVAVINPINYYINNNNPKVYLTNIRINNNDIMLLDSMDDLELENDQNNIVFEYTGISYRDANELSFSYILEGYDKEWKTVDNLRRAEYTNLDSGQYVFRVRCMNPDGFSSVEEAVITFEIEELFTETPYFFGLLVLSFLLIGTLITYSVMRYRHASLIKREKELKLRVEERTRELKSAQNELIKNVHLAAVGETAGQTAHEILNPLTIISGNVSKLHDSIDDTIKPAINLIKTIAEGWYDDFKEGGFTQLKKTLETKVEYRDNYLVLNEDIDNLFNALELLKEYLDTISTNYSLITDEIYEIFSIIDKIKELAEHKPAKKVYLIREIINETANTFSQSFVENKITFVLKCSNDDLHIKIDKNDLIQVLSHIFKNSIEAIVTSDNNKTYNITAELYQKNKNIVIKVTDNGCGINEKNRSYIFEAGFTTRTKKGNTGFGLSISRRLVRAHGGDIYLSWTEPNKGTAIVIQLPL